MVFKHRGAEGSGALFFGPNLGGGRELKAFFDFEYAVLQCSEPAKEDPDIAFVLIEALVGRFRESVECLEEPGLGVVDHLANTIEDALFHGVESSLETLFKGLKISLGGRAAFHLSSILNA